MSSPNGRLQRVLLGVVLLVFCAAPTPGDIGGCGQSPDLLDAETFFGNKKRIDCERCLDCGLASDACVAACDAQASFPSSFPEDCVPLVHDGEVCLRALQHASCGDYESFMDDQSPQTPSECEFCPPRGSP